MELACLLLHHCRYTCVSFVTRYTIEWARDPMTTCKVPTLFARSPGLTCFGGDLLGSQGQVCPHDHFRKRKHAGHRRFSWCLVCKQGRAAAAGAKGKAEKEAFSSPPTATVCSCQAFCLIIFDDHHRPCVSTFIVNAHERLIDWLMRC